MTLRETVRRKRRGMALVETAIVLPVLLALTFGMVEYGWLFMKQSQIGGIARNAVRVAVLPGSTNATVLSGISATMTSDGLGSSGYTVSFTPGNVSTVASGQPLTVEITVPYGAIGLLNTPLIPVPANLTASTTMTKEGP